MRSIEEVKADIAKHEAEIADVSGRTDEHGNNTRFYQTVRVKELNYELRATITAAIPLDELEAMCTAWKDGRCIALPCLTGTIVYTTNTGKIKEQTVTEFGFEITGWFKLAETGYVQWNMARFGKTVFLTRPEAEAALHDMSLTETSTAELAEKEQG